MHIPIAPLFFILTSLQESLFSYLGYDNAANVCAMSSWFFIGSTATQTLQGLVTVVEIKLQIVDRQVDPLVNPWLPHGWITPRLDFIPLSSLVESLSTRFPTIGAGAEAEYSPYATFSYDGVTPTRPSSAVAPVHAFIAGLSASTTSFVPSVTAHPRWNSLAADQAPSASYAIPTPTPSSASTTPTSAPPDEWAFYSPSATSSPFAPSIHTIGVDASVSEVPPALSSSSAGITSAEHATATSTIHVATTTSLLVSTTSNSTHYSLRTELPRSSSRATPGPSRRWTFQHGWMLGMVVSIAVQVGIGLYFSRNRVVQCCHQDSETATVAEMVQIRCLLEGLGDIPYILDDYELSPRELRDYIDMASQPGNTVDRKAQGNGKGEPATPEVLSTREKAVRTNIESSTKSHRSAAASPITALPPSPSQVDVRSRSNVGRSPAKLGAPFSPCDSPQLASRVARLTEGIRLQNARVDQALDELVRVAADFPRPSPVRSIATGSSSWIERRKTARRAEVNVSPLAHKALRRTEGGLPTPDPSRGQYQVEELRAGRTGTSMMPSESSNSMVLNPPAASSPAYARYAQSPAADYSLSQTWRTVGLGGIPSSGTMSTIAPSTSQSGPSLLAEPLPPQTVGEISFGSPSSRPHAAEPNTMVQVESCVMIHKREWLAERRRESGRE